MCLLQSRRDGRRRDDHPRCRGESRALCGARAPRLSAVGVVRVHVQQGAGRSEGVARWSGLAHVLDGRRRRRL